MILAVAAAADLAAHIGAPFEAPDRVEIAAADIAAFIALSGDDAPLHRGANAIAPANLLLALVPRLLKSAVRVAAPGPRLTVRIDDARFLRPVRVGDRLGLDGVLLRAAPTRLGVLTRAALRLTRGSDVVLRVLVDDLYAATHSPQVSD